MSIAKNVEFVKNQIAMACERAGRSPEEVTIVAVTKYVDVPEIQALLDAGITHIGESRVQAAEAKLTQLEGKNFVAHMIGHLQRNKVARCLQLVDLIHSVDSWRLLVEIDKQGARLGKVTPCLLQVNVSGEATKFGFSPEQLHSVLEGIHQLPHVTVKGLMTMAPHHSNPEDTRPVFRSLRRLAEQIKAQNMPGVHMDELSMGMSNDYAIAVEEGATMVRIGSALFA